DIVACPIVREPDGLAMSSRNLLLQPEKRKKAPIISHSLFDSCNFAQNHSVLETQDFVINAINVEKSFKIEYFEIVDGETLQPVKDWKESNCIVGCIAVFAGEVRLIDNVIYKNSES
ncbi:MAG TPA: pantoate--beta-alanine ligase, partial [Marinilabiliaceae bacterium]|nr:pantoate--beta-alanine ligase [Marinilabiliaceae bacterium]